ncbi:E3 ubiquitin-protein ligase Praja-2 [Pogoniulus pusillus]|uniref:E3 ubiquitin-protein ligase Praja-2 n=1 Tax=Pogoniulus pusillus TaxID=488313 RepID=UPI0030B98840
MHYKASSVSLSKGTRGKARNRKREWVRSSVAAADDVTPPVSALLPEAAAAQPPLLPGTPLAAVRPHGRRAGVGPAAAGPRLGNGRYRFPSLPWSLPSGPTRAGSAPLLGTGAEASTRTRCQPQRPELVAVSSPWPSIGHRCLRKATGVPVVADADEPVIENTGSGEPSCQSMSNQTFGMNTSPFSRGLEGSQPFLNFLSPYENLEDLIEYISGWHNDLNSQNRIAFVNIDSYEPDSSDGEEDDAQDKSSLAREEAGVFQETLDNMFSELESDTETCTDLPSRLPAHNHSTFRECCEEAGPIPFMRYFSIDSDLDCPNNKTFKFFAEDQAVLKRSPTVASYETQPIQNVVDVGIRSPMAIDIGLNASKEKADQRNSSELVVRPKIRKQNTTNQSERGKLLPSGEEGSDSWRRIEIAEVQQDHLECVLRNSKEDSISSIFFNSRACEGHQKNMETVLKKNLSAQEQENLLDDSTFEDEFEDCSTHFPMSHKDESSSECSDGEWSTSLYAYFTGTEKDRSSSEESWETDPGREEHEPEVQSSDSDVEENIGISCEEGQKILLEEGEIPWLQYREVESSSDEEDDPVNDVHPGFFPLDGNNNLEDDSSVSEDLDVEWSILDEFGDHLRLAIHSMGLQFHTFVPIEGHLQPMEAALEQLEALEFEAEQHHPPATEEIIDSLPEMVIMDDRNGQDQCCIICYDEYVEGEILKQLPCRHVFHRSCVTLWLQESGTCPVCRHVLVPVLPEAALDIDSHV